jgi:acyl-CoA synthetase (NDP forming)
LRPLLAPRSIAVVGASTNPAKVGGMPVRLLREHGYDGAVYPVNPGATHIQGLPAWSSIASVGEPVDLAILAVPAAACQQAVEEALRAGVRALVVFASGFAETGDAGARAQEAMAAAAREHGALLLGPNCLGAMNLHRKMFATFSPVALGPALPAGRVSLASQSGAFGGYAFSLAREAGLPLGYWITTGNEAGVQVADAIHWLAADAGTDVILAYLEGAREPERLRAALQAAREARKPVVAVKVGATTAGRRAARLHTGSDTGDDAWYAELFAEFGVHRAHGIDALLRAGAVLASPARRARARSAPASAIGIFTISGGIGIMMADRAEALGLELPPLPDDVAGRLREAIPFAVTSNPIDVTGQAFAQPEVVAAALKETARCGRYAGLAVFLAAAGRAPGVWPVLQAAIAELADDPLAAPLFVSGLLEPSQREWLSQRGCLAFREPGDAVDALAVLARTE